jgi:hypothetical protein
MEALRGRRRGDDGEVDGKLQLYYRVTEKGTKARVRRGRGRGEAGHGRCEGGEHRPGLLRVASVKNTLSYE